MSAFVDVEVVANTPKKEKPVKAYRHKWNYLKLWKANICFIETLDCVLIIKRFKLTLPKSFEFQNYDAFAWKQDQPKGGTYYYIVARPGVKPHILVHECVHLAMFILSDRGVGVQEGNDEPLAYSVDYLFSEANAFYSLKK